MNFRRSEAAKKSLRDDLAVGWLVYAESVCVDMTIVKGLIAGFVVLTGLMIPSIGRADTIQFDQNLSTPNGVYYGSGKVNGGFTVVQSNGIEIGLRAKLRDPSLTGEDTIIHSTTNVYTLTPIGDRSPVNSIAF
jgi:hypothetical protein